MWNIHLVKTLREWHRRKGARVRIRAIIEVWPWRIPHREGTRSGHLETLGHRSRRMTWGSNDDVQRARRCHEELKAGFPLLVRAHTPDFLFKARQELNSETQVQSFKARLINSASALDEASLGRSVELQKNNVTLIEQNIKILNH